MVRVTTLTQASSYLDHFIRPTDYEKFNTSNKNPLDRMKYLLSLLENPHKKFPSIVVSGTSGKGSTTYMISSILTKAGYKTGMTISPHLQHITERLQINNQHISEGGFVQVLQSIIPAIEEMKTSEYGEPSYFEILLAMVFVYFAKEKIDIAIIEVGLEGKFDGTNVLDPLVFVLTNISLDHTQILGNTIEAIAEEATARIENSGKKDSHAIVVSGVKQKSIIEIVQKKCQKAGAELFLLGKDFDCTIKKESVRVVVFDFKSGFCFENIHLSLTGSYQAENASLAIAAVLQLEQFGFRVSESVIRETLAEIKIPGRFEVIRHPGLSRIGSTTNNHRFWASQNDEKKEAITLILDGAHNPAKMEAFLGSLEKVYPKDSPHPSPLPLEREKKELRKIFIVGFSQGHQYEQMLEHIANVADVLILTHYTATTDMGKNRAVHIADIKPACRQAGFKNNKIQNVIFAANPKEALGKGIQIIEESKRPSILIVTGSLYLVGKIKELL